jgi:hypothetical protein
MNGGDSAKTIFLLIICILSCLYLHILCIFIYSYFSSELDKDFTNEFNYLRPNTRQIKIRKRRENN